jgi:ferredoxin-type protein NapH
MVAMAEQNWLNSLTSKLVPWRVWVQTTFLLVWLDPLGARWHSVCAPVFHCYACPLATFSCPIGVLANFSALHILPFVALGLLIGVGALFGSLLCGWACPFGLAQDLVARVRTPKFDPPRWTGHLRYVVLAGAVFAVPFFFGDSHPLFICGFCPAGAVEGAVPNMIRQAAAGGPVVLPNPLKLTVLLLLVGAVFFVYRPWCRVLCPLGAIFSLFNRASVFFLHLDPNECTHCDRCHKLCQLGLQPQKSPNDSRCVRCLECTRCGPQALSISTIFSRKKGIVGSTSSNVQRTLS